MNNIESWQATGDDMAEKNPQGKSKKAMTKAAKEKKKKAETAAKTLPK
jgi:hypothetical protein